MNEGNPRVTMIMGAGAVLDMNFPCSLLRPSTWNFTQEVIKPYANVFDKKKEITVVGDIYKRLMEVFPVNSNIWWEKDPKPNIRFEILFHVMEQLMAYESVWEGKNHNPDIYPHFAPFTARNFDFHSDELRQLMLSFIMRIMDIVNAYNEYFRNDKEAEDWFRDFFKSDFKWNVFNFNYDTTVELLEIMSNCSYIGDMTADFIDPDVHKPKYAKNGNLLLVTSGMKEVSSIRNEIYSFLKS